VELFTKGEKKGKKKNVSAREIVACEHLSSPRSHCSPNSCFALAGIFFRPRREPVRKLANLESRASCHAKKQKTKNIPLNADSRDEQFTSSHTENQLSDSANRRVSHPQLTVSKVDNYD